MNAGTSPSASAKKSNPSLTPEIAIPLNGQAQPTSHPIFVNFDFPSLLRRLSGVEVSPSPKKTMFHLLYILAFTVLAVLAVSNMIRNMVRLGTQATQPPGQSQRQSQYGANRPVPHPELLNDSGDVINEPLLVMRSISMKDAREQLNALYESSSESSGGEEPSTEES
ncbi:MAG: DUF2973 domain-containing protein [Cyanobacteria bacterium J06560_6]